ncbi:hypothetical protein ACJX0J_037107, partial [Zea mays]
MQTLVPSTTASSARPMAPRSVRRCARRSCARRAPSTSLAPPAAAGRSTRSIILTFSFSLCRLVPPTTVGRYVPRFLGFLRLVDDGRAILCSCMSIWSLIPGQVEDLEHLFDKGKFIRENLRTTQSRQKSY